MSAPTTPTPREVMARVDCQCAPGTCQMLDGPDKQGLWEGCCDIADAHLAALAAAGFAVRSDAEVAAQVAAAVMAEREACAGVGFFRPDNNAADVTVRQFRAAIFARPAPAGADVLAAMLAQARREGIEAAAKLIRALARDATTAGAVVAPDGLEALAESLAVALLPAPDAALAQDFTAWTEGNSDG